MFFKKIANKCRYFIGKKITNSRFREYIKENKILKLQLGAGHIHLDGWFNTDLYSDKENNIYCLDMLKKFDFKDNFFDFIYSEHNIEHFELCDLYKILNECLRVLKPNGIIRLATPDLMKIIKMYMQNDEINDKYCKWQTDSFIPFAKNVNLYSKAIVFNNFFKCWGHKIIYDYETLYKVLENVGFKDIQRFETNKSNYEDLINIESHWKVIGRDYYELETMVVEARK